MSSNPSPLRPYNPGAPYIPDPTTLTVREAIDLYVAHDSKRIGRCPRAAAERERIWLEFCELYGDRLVAQCRAADLQLWIDSHARWRSDWTIRRALRTMQRPFSYLLEIGILGRNPFRGLSHPSGGRGRPIEPAEFQKILRKSPPLYRRVLVFLRFSGCRPGELRSLQWDHISFEQEHAVLKEHKTARTRKDHQPRIMILHPVCVRLLIWLRRNQPVQKFVFLNSHGKPWSRGALDRRLNRLRTTLGLDPSCKLYGCRHEWATRLAMAGVDVATLAVLLGHTSWAMAQNYVHVAQAKEHLHEAVRKGMRRK